MMTKPMDDDKCEYCGSELFVGWTSFDLGNERCKDGDEWEEFCENCGGLFKRQFDKANKLVITLLSFPPTWDKEYDN